MTKFEAQQQAAKHAAEVEANTQKMRDMVKANGEATARGEDQVPTRNSFPFMSGPLQVPTTAKTADGMELKVYVYDVTFGEEKARFGNPADGAAWLKAKQVSYRQVHLGAAERKRCRVQMRVLIERILSTVGEFDEVFQAGECKKMREAMIPFMAAVLELPEDGSALPETEYDERRGKRNSFHLICEFFAAEIEAERRAAKAAKRLEKHRGTATGK